MMAITNPDRRHFPRKNAEGTIKILPIPDDIETREESCSLIPVHMYDQSEGGIYVEIDRALQPGLNIRIKMVAPEKNHPEEAYYLRDGRVVWCKKVEEESHLFGVGIKILRKVVRAPVLTSRFGRTKPGSMHL
jgi:Tfp pilus assembly protein PilZ